MTSVLTVLCALTATSALPERSVGLEWDQAGRRVLVRCGGREISGGDAADAGFAVRDCARQPEYEVVRGAEPRLEPGMLFTGRNADETLEVVATFVPEEHWFVIRGRVRNLTDEDAAVSLRFGLPAACEGWLWGRSLHKTTRLVPKRRMHLGVATRLGSGHMALRPMAAITDGTWTMGLALPMDHIGQYDFFADTDRRLFAVVLDFAMTRHCPRFHKEAPFEFYVLWGQSGWGLRAVLQQVYEAVPRFFDRHVPEAGGWFAWGDILRQPPPVSDYGLAFHEQPESAEGGAHDTALGIRVYPYIEAGMYQMCMGDQEERPSREFALARLRDWARPEASGRLPSGGFPTQEALRRISAAVVASGPKGADGELLIGRIGQYPWISGSRWAAQFPLNLAPAIPDGAGQVRLEEALKLAERPHANGVYLDSYSAHLKTIDYAKEHLTHLTYPPLFDGKTCEPCDLAGFAKWAWVDALWEGLPEAKRSLLPNLYGQPVPFPWHRFTVFGKEHWTSPTGQLMQQYRSMAYRRIVTQLPAYEDRDERFLRNLLLLDVFPGGYARRSTDPPQGMRLSYRLVIPLLRLLDRLGWEPVTHARPLSPGLRMERYGSAPGPVALAVYNPYAAGIARMEIAAADLHLPINAYPVSWLDEAPVEYVRKGGRLTAALGLEGNSTDLLVVGGRTAQAEWLRMLADDRLDDARRCLLEYAVRRKEVSTHPAAEALQALTGEVQQEEFTNAATRITGDAPTEVRARELLVAAGDLLRRAASTRQSAVPVSRTPVLPATTGPQVLPWTETFDSLEPALWEVSVDHPGVRVKAGRLEMELPRDKSNVGVNAKRPLPLAPKPLIVECDFKYSHAGHPKYLMLGLRLSSSASGADEFLLVRIEGKGPGTVRVENHEAPATDWQFTLTDWHRFDHERSHRLRLKMGPETYRLEIDGNGVGEGPHDCGFGSGYLSLFLYSGHRGNGDVCWWDNLRAYADPE